MLLPSSSEQEQVNLAHSWLYFSAPLFALAFASLLYKYQLVQVAWVVLFILLFVYMLNVLQDCSDNGLLLFFPE